MKIAGIRTLIVNAEMRNWVFVKVVCIPYSHMTISRRAVRHLRSESEQACPTGVPGMDQSEMARPKGLVQYRRFMVLACPTKPSSQALGDANTSQESVFTVVGQGRALTAFEADRTMKGAFRPLLIDALLSVRRDDIRRAKDVEAADLAKQLAAIY